MWDIFISHASEDKKSLVEKLAKQLKEIYKVDVWYDEFSLKYGDSLIDSIEEGLKKSKFGVVVLSENFFKKQWTSAEYKSLRTKEMLLDKKVIIPIWYNVTREEVYNYSSFLADKFAIPVNNDFDIDDLAIKIIEIIRPDIYNNISRMSYIENINKNAKEVEISYKDWDKIPVSPIRHKKLSRHMMARLKLVYYVIKDVGRMTYDEYEEAFRRNTNIDREIIITELITAAYIDCINKRKMTELEKLKVYILTLSLGKGNVSVGLSDNEINEFNKIINSYLDQLSSAEIMLEFRFEK